MNATAPQTESSPPDERLAYDLPEFCQRMGISYRHGIALANEGNLPGAFQLGRKWLISKAAVDEMLKGNTQTR